MVPTAWSWVATTQAVSDPCEPLAIRSRRMHKGIKNLVMLTPATRVTGKEFAQNTRVK